MASARLAVEVGKSGCPGQTEGRNKPEGEKKMNSGGRRKKERDRGREEMGERRSWPELSVEKRKERKEKRRKERKENKKIKEKKEKEKKRK